MEKHLRRKSIMDKFIRYADTKGIIRRNNMILRSKPLLERAVYGSIIYNMLEMNDYMQYLNHRDPTIEKAVELFKNKQTTPTLHGQENTPSTDTQKKKRAYCPAARTVQHLCNIQTA